MKTWRKLEIKKESERVYEPKPKAEPELEPVK